VARILARVFVFDIEHRSQFIFLVNQKKFNLVAIGGPSSQVNNQGDPGSEEVGPGLNSLKLEKQFDNSK
jgi:hypothetical protein